MSQQGEVARLRVSLGLETLDFSRGMRDANNRLKALNSELRVIATSSDRFDNSLDNLRQRSNVLTRTMDVHRSKVEELKRQYEESVRVNGENADATIRLVTQYNQAQAAMNRTEQQLRDVNSQIQEQESAFGQLRNSVNENISSMSRELRVLETGFQASAAGMEDLGDEVGQLRREEEYLTQSFDLQSRRVQELARLHQAAAESTGENSQETQELEIRLNRATQEMRETERRLNETTQSIEEQSNVWNRLGNRVSEAGAQLQDAGERMNNVGSGITTAVTAPIIGFGAAAIKTADDFDSAAGKIEAKLGVTTARAQELEEIGKDVWRNAFGESVADAGDAVAVVTQNMRDLSDEDLKNVTEAAFTFRDTFENDISETTRTAGVLMKTFGDDGKYAMDLLFRGTQLAGAAGEDLLDTFTEYSPQFASLGLSSREAMNLLIQGLREGAMNTDVIADSIKEFTIEAEKSGERVAAGYSKIGLDGKKMMENIADGGDKANGAFYATIAALAKVKDETKLNTAGAEIFGTKWEDVKKNVLTSLNPAVDLLGDVEGATKKAGDALYNNFGSKATVVFRDIQEDLIPIGEDLLEIAEDIIPPLADGIGKITGAFADMDPEAQKATLAIGGIAAAAGPLVITAGATASAIGGIATALGGSGGLAGALGALTGPVGLTIGALGALTLGGIAYKNSVDESKKVSLEYADSLINQFSANEQLIEQYDQLQTKSSLTGDQFARLVDLNQRIKDEADPEKIAILKDEFGKLQANSGLTNDELAEMLGLNSELTSKIPEATNQITEQGNRIADTTGKMKEYNQEFADQALREYEQELNKALGNQEESLERIKILQGELSTGLDKEKLLRGLIYDISDKEKGKMIEKIQNQLSSNQLTGVEKTKAEETLLLLGLKEDSLRTALSNQMSINDETQKTLSNEQKSIQNIDGIINKMKNVVLAEVGLNNEKGKGISLVDNEISKLNSKKKKLQDSVPFAQRNTAEYRDQVGQIEAQIGRLEGVKGKIREIDRLAGKDVTKTVNVKVNIPNSLRTKGLEISAFAKGTRNAPEGMAWVGEEGPELVYLPGGSRVIPNGPSMQIATGLATPNSVMGFTHPDAIRILRSWNIPMLEKGGDITRSGFALVGEKGPELVGAMTRPNNKGQFNQEEKQVSVNVQVQPAPIVLNGREVGLAIYKDVDSLISFEEKRKKVFNQSNR